MCGNPPLNRRGQRNALQASEQAPFTQRHEHLARQLEGEGISFRKAEYGSQVEYGTNLVFKERAALDRMAERLLDLNRSIGRPDKLSTIFGYRITKAYRGVSRPRSPTTTWAIRSSAVNTRPAPD